MSYQCLTLSASEVSMLLGMSIKWVYKNKTKIPGYFKIGSAIFFDKEVFYKELKKRSSKKHLDHSLGLT